MSEGATEQTYLVAGSKSWNRQVFDEDLTQLAGNWRFVAQPDQLTGERVRQLNPRYIFFLHWSRRVPDEVVENYECVCFHMTDVPYGRGGSPLQNLILRGHEETTLTALRMTGELYGGPVYLKEHLCLAGSAEEIYIRATRRSARMIRRIIGEQLRPQPQVGEVTRFRRRKPEQSEMPELKSPENLFDFVRMLDAEGYPRAFITHKGFRYEFSRATLRADGIVADVKITRLKESD